jgi:hypothetical protein
MGAWRFALRARAANREITRPHHGSTRARDFLAFIDDSADVRELVRRHGRRAHPVIMGLWTVYEPVLRRHDAVHRKTGVALLAPSAMTLRDATAPEGEQVASREESKPESEPKAAYRRGRSSPAMRRKRGKRRTVLVTSGGRGGALMDFDSPKVVGHPKKPHAMTVTAAALGQLWERAVGSRDAGWPAIYNLLEAVGHAPGRLGDLRRNAWRYQERQDSRIADLLNHIELVLPRFLKTGLL